MIKTKLDEIAQNVRNKLANMKLSFSLFCKELDNITLDTKPIKRNDELDAVSYAFKLRKPKYNAKLQYMKKKSQRKNWRKWKGFKK